MTNLDQLSNQKQANFNEGGGQRHPARSFQRQVVWEQARDRHCTQLATCAAPLTVNYFAELFPFSRLSLLIVVPVISAMPKLLEAHVAMKMLAELISQKRFFVFY